MKKNNNLPLKIAVGTKSEQKLGYLFEVLRELGIEVSIEDYNVASGVAEQPLTSEETLKGAMNRAQAALNRSQDADYGMGIEVGYDRVNADQYGIFCWTVLVDREGKTAKAKSHTFLLPSFHNKVVEEGNYLSDYVREYFNYAPDNLTQYVAELMRGRRLYIMESMRYALIYALHVGYENPDEN